MCKATGQSEDERVEWPETATETLRTHDSKKQLIRNLVKLPDILSEVEAELYPNRLCDYLFETSQKFNQVRYISRATNTPPMTSAFISIFPVPFWFFR